MSTLFQTNYYKVHLNLPSPQPKPLGTHTHTAFVCSVRNVRNVGRRRRPIATGGFPCRRVARRRVCARTHDSTKARTHKAGGSRRLRVFFGFFFGHNCLSKGGRLGRYQGRHRKTKTNCLRDLRNKSCLKGKKIKKNERI